MAYLAPITDTPKTTTMLKPPTQTAWTGQQPVLQSSTGTLTGMPKPTAPAPTGVSVPAPTSGISQVPLPPPIMSQNAPSGSTQFGPGQDLRFTQFAPVSTSPTTNQQLQNAQNQVAGFSGFGTYTGNPNASQVSGLQDQARSYTQGAILPNFGPIQNPDQSQA